MGFCFNRQRQLAVADHSNALEDDLHKKKTISANRSISRVNVKQLRRKLSPEDRAFLRSIGLKLRK